MEIAIYNTKDKELIGVFRNMAIASRYIFSNHSKYNANRILNCFERKGKLFENLIFDFPVTVRRANDKHLKLLNDSDVYISEGYPKMPYYRIEGMKSCRTKMNNKTINNETDSSKLFATRDIERQNHKSQVH